MQRMNKLSFQIQKAEFSNDHEVHPIVDGRDIIGDDYLGLDPPDLVRELTPSAYGSILIGRCECGCIGCDDVFVDVSSNTKNVTWSTKGKAFEFRISDYSTALKALADDHSWEDVGRRVERLIAERVRMDKRWASDGTRFDWVSTRVAPFQLTYSFTTNGEQRLFETGWDGCDEGNAMRAHSRLFHERFR